MVPVIRGLTLWHLGYPDQALKRSNEAVALAQGLSHPPSLALAEFLSALFVNTGGRYARLRRLRRV